MYLQSVGRALRLLTLVALESTDGTAKALADKAELAVPTAHHLLSTLVAEGYLTKDDQVRYSIGPRVDLLSQVAQRRTSMPAYLQQALKKLASTTHETAYVASWRQGEIVLLGSIEGTHPVHVSVPAGQYLDAHARATGKALLAFTSATNRDMWLSAHVLRPVTPNTISDRARLAVELERITADGYATDEEEYLDGVSCVSAPVLVNDLLLGAFSVSVPSNRFQQRRADLIRAVQAIASDVAAAIGQPGTPGPDELAAEGA